MKKDIKIEYVAEEESESFEKKYKKLKKALGDIKKEKAEYLDGWQRARAELQNYIKQSEKDKEEFRKFALSDFVSRILPIIDNLSLALSSIPKELEDNKWAKGINYIRKQTEDTLKELGVEEIKAYIGLEFDPAYHEAVEKVKSREKKGALVEIIQKGYLLHGKAIRAAKVKVAK